MKTRVAGAILWTYFAWYGWSFYAGMTGLNPLLGPLAVMIALAVVAALKIHQDLAAAEGQGAVASPASAHPSADPA